MLFYPRGGSGRYAKCDSKRLCMGTRRKVDKGGKTALFASFFVPQPGMSVFQPSPPESASGLNNGHFHPALSDRCPFLLFARVVFPGGISYSS